MTSRQNISNQASELRQQAEEIALEKSALSLEDIHAMTSEERLQAALNSTAMVLFNQDSGLRYTWIHNSLLRCLERAADKRSTSLHRNSP
jgi:hypothetical protein